MTMLRAETRINNLSMPRRLKLHDRGNITKLDCQQLLGNHCFDRCFSLTEMRSVLKDRRKKAVAGLDGMTYVTLPNIGGVAAR